MIDFAKIKLIIWDLDGTFWNGILSEHTAVFDEANAKLIRNMADAGVISSICSKNDAQQVTELMQKHGIADLFVFNSINWSPKGERVKQIIDEMNLRAVNVLFIDDNPTNLGEAQAYCPELMVSDETIVPALREFFDKASKKDTAHKRLEQYRVLEKKQSFRAASGTNEEFLRKCNIQVEIKTDCLDHLERIADLVQRSNQLNFTKLRSSADELRSTIENDAYQTGYVEVKDKFGDYGIVGFYAITENVLQHFVFSCRTLNMGVEQYVYHTLGKPSLTIVGDVSSSLEGDRPDWINVSSGEEADAGKAALTGKKILIKGPCDMMQMFSFIKETSNIVTEFSYVNNRGILIEQGNHTVHIVESLQLGKEQKRSLEKTLPFGDAGMFRTALFDADTGAVIFSLFNEANLGLYREKTTGAIVVFGEYTNDLTDESMWNDILSGNVFTANCRFKESDLRDIRDRFEFLGRIQPEETIRNLEFIYSRMNPEALLILCLGSETPFEKNTQPAYEDRHVFHRGLNAAIRKWAEDKNRVKLLDVNHYVKGQDDFTNNINHFQKYVYFHLSEELISILNSESEEVLQLATEKDKRKQVLLRKIRNIPNKILRTLRGSK